MFPSRTRPASLANRNCCYSDEQIAAISTKPLGSLSWSDFDAIFTLSGCTAEYEQQLYYLPLALDHLIVHPSDGVEYLPGLINFVASNAARLRRDAYFGPSIHALRKGFERWTKSFVVVHFDAEACSAKGWRIEHSDLVENSSAVRELIDALLRYGISDLAEDLIGSWQTENRSHESSAWLLEFAKEEREAYEYYSHEGVNSGGVDMTPTKRFPRLRELILNDSLLQREYDRIKNTIVQVKTSPTYWPDLVARLRLAA